MTVAKWKNYLIGMNFEPYTEEYDINHWNSRYYSATGIGQKIKLVFSSIHVFDIDTDESYDISLNKPINLIDWGNQTAISQILNNTYFFGIGTDLGPKLDYGLKLPPQRTASIKTISKSPGSVVEKFGNNYVGVYSYEGNFYSLFNPNTLYSKFLDRVSFAFNASGRGYGREEFIGIDSRGRAIINIRDASNDPNDTTNQFPFDSIMIAAIPLEQENVTIPILDNKDYPENLTSFFMIDGSDKILMFGTSKAYIYDISISSVRPLEISSSLAAEFSDQTNEYSSRFIRHQKNGDLICFLNNGGDVIDGINLDTETYLNPPYGNCIQKRYFDKSVEEKFSDLNLTNDFELIHNQQSYKIVNTVNGLLKSELPKDEKYFDIISD
jgi:hypothetical protein